MAAPLPAEAAEQLWHELASLRARHSEARWLEPAKLHLTLVFLGATDPAELDRLSAALAEVTGRWRPFEVVTGRAGGYLGRRGGVGWLGIGQGRRELSRLAHELDRAMGSAVYERTSPRPHLTLARGLGEPLLAELQTITPAESRFRVARLQLLRSHTGPAGSRYEELVGFELSA